jgi:hypothetical protein
MSMVRVRSSWGRAFSGDSKEFTRWANASRWAFDDLRPSRARDSSFLSSSSLVRFEAATLKG